MAPEQIKEIDAKTGADNKATGKDKFLEWAKGYDKTIPGWIVSMMWDAWQQGQAEGKKFKDYVHGRLDVEGVEKDPQSPHREQGCRIGGRLDIVLNRTCVISDLVALHAKFGDLPAMVSDWDDRLKYEFFQFRKDFIHEEYLELRGAETPEDAVDAMIDLIVVTVGTLHAFGIDFKKAWDLVHTANMAKSPGANPTRPNKFGLPDLIKPEGWAAPDHTGNTSELDHVFKVIRGN